jgi:hypothetical protein
LFAVTDFKLGKFDIDLGMGYGLTPGSDRLIAKAIIGYAFPVPGKEGGASDPAPKRAPMVRPLLPNSLGRAPLSNLLAIQ